MEELVNRAAVIMSPRQPYLDWCKQDDAEGLAEDVFQTMRSEPQVYLLPDADDPGYQERLLKKHWRVLFELMLEGWVTDESLWPKKRTRAMFDEWFDVQVTSMVVDLDVGKALAYY